MSWLDEREKEKELADTLADLNRRIQANKEERDYWDKYITWVDQNRDKMQDVNATLGTCEKMKEELKVEYDVLIKKLNETKDELDRIRCLGAFVKWVRVRKGF